NLGLMGTAELARNAVPNSRKVNGKSLAADVILSAEDIKGEPRFNTTIDLTGLSSDRYYPVWWRFPHNYDGANAWLTIHRTYSEDREKNPFGENVTHLAGLQLQIEGSEVAWGGDAQYLNIKRIRQTYRNTVKNIRYQMMSIARPVDDKYPLYGGVKSGDTVEAPVLSGCYLRGGLTYHVTSNFFDIHYSREDGEVEAHQSIQPHNNFEIKWMVKSYAIDDPLLGKDYSDTVLPYAHDYAETINLAKNAYPKTGGTIEGKVSVSSNIEATGWIGGKELRERKSDGGWVRAYSPQNKPTAEEIQAEPRFNKSIDLTGLSPNRYYPVWWNFPSNNRGANSWLTIHRNYAEDRDDKNPFGKETHLAGLELQIEGSDVPWGGDSHYLNIKRIYQRYRNTVKKIQYGMMSIARPVNGKYPLYNDWKSGQSVECYVYSGCYLRGGLTYHITSNFSEINYSRNEEEVEIAAWSNADSTDTNKREIKWTVKSYSIDDPDLGKDYDNIVTPYAYDLADMLYPVGIVVWFAQNKNPNTLFPKTQWKYIGENKTIRLANQNGSNVLSIGGNDSVTLTGSQIPSHNHSFSATTSSFDYGTKTTNSNGNHFHDSGWGEASGARYGIYDNTNNNVGSARTDHDNYKYKTSTEGAHSHAVHIGAHTHSVSGTTGNSGSSSTINITNSYIMLMGWYRIS
ncbi:phage baseplate protein, partial [Xenorhabdus littoralis]|uniref:phage baseplate protein n=1 Tax=Xenorhabdus littoralis TaxID=2582835 RepID=UPI0029E80753